MLDCVHSSVTPQLCGVSCAAPVDLVVDILLLDVQVAVVRLQLDFALLTVDEHEVTDVASDVGRCVKHFRFQLIHHDVFAIDCFKVTIVI